MKNRDKYFRELVALFKDADTYELLSLILDIEYHSIENDACKLTFWNPAKASAIFATIHNNDSLYPRIISNITKRKAVRLLKRYGFKVDWERYNKLIYGDTDEK